MRGAEPKPPWRSVPRAVRRQVENLIGWPIVRGTTVWGGYAPSPTFRLFLADGRRVFFKGVGPTSNAHMQRAIRAEERVYRELGPWIAPWSPMFFGSFQHAEWYVLLLEDLGRPSVPPWTRSALSAVMEGYAEFHQHSLGQDLPNWLSRQWHQAFARMWTELADEDGGLDGVANLAGGRAAEALAWLHRSVKCLRSAAETLAAVGPPHALLHLDTRSDNLRLQPGGRLRLFDWPYACVGPPELDLAAFAQSITCEGGPDPDAVIAAYTTHLPVRAEVIDAAAATMAGFFAHHAWRPDIPDLPRLRSIQRRQLKSSLVWAARRLRLPEPTWLEAVRP
jgi:thiamine kinase-like enzyme